MIEQIRQFRMGGEISVSTTAVVVAPLANRRWEAMIQNMDSTLSVKMGTAEQLAASKGTVVAPGEVYRHNGRGACHAQTASGTVAVRVLEVMWPGNNNDVAREQSVTAGTTAVVLLPRDLSRFHAVLENTGSATVYVGDSTVTKDTGIAVAAGKQLDLYGGMSVYGVTASSTSAVRVVTEGRR